MHKLATINKERVLDVLLERLWFERAGVQLYDAILRRVQQSADDQVRKMLPQLEEYREEEKEHEEWLEEQVRSIGGDAHAKSDRARLVEEEAAGIEKIVMNPTAELSHCFHALLLAELADNAGWDLLVQLADEADDSDARKQLKKRLHQEEEHLLFVRKAMERFARREVLQEEVGLPVGP